MIDPCGCSTDAAPAPLSIVNRPGQSALDYRIGTHATFFNAMRSRLSASDLTGLKTREANDPAIALLDAWATVADVLTFYQDRIANEGYLRTATERRSVLELAQLVGSSLRPGLSASVSLAYSLEPTNVSTIPAGSRIQSVPVQDQLPQSFEISDDLPARGVWNNLAPRLTKPQQVTVEAETIYVAGLTPNLKPNDPLLLVADRNSADPSRKALRKIIAVRAQAEHDRTRVDMEPVPRPAAQGAAVSRTDEPAVPGLGAQIASFHELIEPLTRPAAEHPLNARHLLRTMSQTFDPRSDAVPAAVRMLNPEIRAQFFNAWRNAKVAPDPSGEVHAFRVKAAPFGHNAPLRQITNKRGVIEDTQEWPLLGGSLSIHIAIPARREVLRDTPDADDSLRRTIALFREDRLSIDIDIAQGTDRGSASSVLAEESERTVDVGRWNVGLSFDRERQTIRLACENPRWSWTIRVSDRTSEVTLEPKDGVRVVVAAGQRVTTHEPDYHLALSAEHGIEIAGEIAVVLPTVIELDSAYEQIVKGSWAAIEFADGRETVVSQIDKVEKVSIARYGLSGRVTRLTLKDKWLDDRTDRMLSSIRAATVLVQSERLELAEEPVIEDVHGDAIELADLYGDIPSGRWLIVEGERTDIPATGVMGAELVMLAGVEQVPAENGHPDPGERKHSKLRLSHSLGHSYKRDTVTVHGNVAWATHGETRNEVLGSGDGSQANQQFTLRQGAITHLPAPVPGGVKSTLEVRVNDILWTEVASLDEAGPFDRSYITRIDDDNRTTIVFGDGINGMRLPTGRENVKATYRAGLGMAGNLPAGAISQLASRPYGVKAVASPLPASGGVDRDERDQGRMQAALKGMVDRLISVQDYVNFSKAFGGIGKAAALLVPGGRQSVVYLCVAGPTPNDDTTILRANLEQALRATDDPHMPLMVDSCELMLLVVAASVKVDADARWDDVEPRIRASLIETFGYRRRDLGQSIALSEVTAAIQLVAGVAYVDVTVLDSIGASETRFDERLNDKLEVITSAVEPPPFVKALPIRYDQKSKSSLPAQLLFLSAQLPDMLLLTEIRP